MKEAILTRLPKDTSIDFSSVLDKPPRIRLSMTIMNTGHVQALRETADVLDRLLEIANASTSQATETTAGENVSSQPGKVQGEPQIPVGTNGRDAMGI